MRTPHFVFMLTIVLAVEPIVRAAQNMEQYWFGLGVVSTIDSHRNNLFDAYNCGPGGKLIIRTNSTANGAMSFGAPGIINGDIIVGVGGNPGQVANLYPGSTVTGAIYAASEPYIYASVTVPADLAASATKGSIAGTMTLSDSGKYDSVLSGSILTIDAPVTLYVTGDISLAQLQITSSGSLTLYAGGSITGGNDLLVNSLSQDPKKLHIFGLDTCTTISWLSSGQFYGAIYAPAANFAAKNSNSIYGAAIVNSIVLLDNNAFHYDASLPEPATFVLLGLGSIALRKRTN